MDYKKLASNQSLDATIEGKSFKWNQIINTSSVTSETISGVTFTNNSDGTITISGTATANITNKRLSQSINNIQNHKFFLYGCSGGSSNTYYFGSLNISIEETGNGTIYTYPYSWDDAIIIKIFNGTTINKTLRPQLIDLTELFGAGNEPTTLSDFYLTDIGKFIKAGNYLPYGSGIQSAYEPLRFVGGKSVDLGTLNWGVDGSSGKQFRYYDIHSSGIGIKGSADFSLVPNLFSNMFIVSSLDNYDATQGNVIGCWQYSESATFTQLTIKSDTFSGKTIAEVKALLSGVILYYESTDGTPYLNLSYTRSGRVDLGSLTWYYNTETGHERFYAFLSDIKTYSASEIGNIVCNKYITDSDDAVYLHEKDRIIGTHNGKIQVYDNTYLDAQSFKTAMSGVYLEYETAQPLELRSVGTVKDILWNCSGKVERKLYQQQLNMASLDWNYDSSNQVFWFPTSSPNKAKNYGKITCNLYETTTATSLANMPNKSISTLPYYLGGNIIIKDTDYTTTASFKSHFANTDVCIYELATPTTETHGTIAIPKIADKCYDSKGDELTIIRNN